MASVAGLRWRPCRDELMGKEMEKYREGSTARGERPTSMEGARTDPTHRAQTRQRHPFVLYPHYATQTPMQSNAKQAMPAYYRLTTGLEQYDTVPCSLLFLVCHLPPSREDS